MCCQICGSKEKAVGRFAEYFSCRVETVSRRFRSIPWCFRWKMMRAWSVDDVFRGKNTETGCFFVENLNIETDNFKVN